MLDSRLWNHPALTSLGSRISGHPRKQGMRLLVSLGIFRLHNLRDNSRRGVSVQCYIFFVNIPFWLVKATGEGKAQISCLFVLS